MSDYPEAMLMVERGIDESSVIPLDGRACVIGKSSTADVFADNPYVSRRHAQIALNGNHFEVRDLGSKNGTFLNGIRLAPEQPGRLSSGDLIELARGQVVLKFREWGATATLPVIDRATSGYLRVDDKSREVWLQNQKLEPALSRKEFDMLSLLSQLRGEAISKDQLGSAGWPERPDGDVSDQDIEQCIRRLRLRIEPDPSRPEHIVTIRGFGYKLTQE